MAIRSFRRLSGAAIPMLAVIGALAVAPAADASTTPTMSAQTVTKVCTDSNSWCSQSLATIPSGAQLQVICNHASSYYVEDLANRALEGYVPKTSVRNPPSGLVDCNVTAHPAIYAAAKALSYMNQDYDPGLCLQFVAQAWHDAGKPIPNATQGLSGTAQDWWYDYQGKLSYAWDTGGSRFKTPPRGALVFWHGDNNYPQYDSQAGHVAISLGNGWMVSTEEGSHKVVHLLTISQRNAEPGVGTYLGWVMPIPGYQIQQ